MIIEQTCDCHACTQARYKMWSQKIEGQLSKFYGTSMTQIAEQAIDSIPHSKKTLDKSKS